MCPFLDELAPPALAFLVSPALPFLSFGLLSAGVPLAEPILDLFKLKIEAPLSDSSLRDHEVLLRSDYFARRLGKES